MVWFDAVKGRQEADHLARGQNDVIQKILRKKQEGRWQRPMIVQERDRLNLERLVLMGPATFESTVCDVLNLLGFRLHVTGGAGDRGIDLKGWGPSGETVVVQCKRHHSQNQVQPRVVREMIGTMVIHQVAFGMIVTSGWFSSQAAREGRESIIPVRLIDVDELIQMIDVLYERA